MRRSHFLLISCDFIYLLNYFSPTSYTKQLGESWSDLSSALLNLHPGNNLLLTVPGLFLASKQLSRSTDFPGPACPQRSPHLTTRRGGRMERNPPNLFYAPGPSFTLAEIQEKLKELEALWSFQMPSQALWKERLWTVLHSRATHHSFKSGTGVVKASTISNHTY